MESARYHHDSQSFAWKAADLADPSRFSLVLDDAERAELRAGVEAWHGAGRPPLATLGRDAFPLQRLARRLADAEQEVRAGRGFVVLRGLPHAGFDADQYAAAVWAIGLHFGGALSQNAAGERITWVEDATATDPTPRMYRSNLELRPHTDPTTIVALASWTRAESGGASVVASAVTVHDEIRRRAPQLLAPLYRGFHMHRLGEQAEGVSPVTERPVPIFANVDGQLSARYLRTSVVAGERALGRELPPEAIAAMNLFDEVAADPAHRLAFFLERGEMIVINNYTVMHARTRFVNPADPERHRRLARLWLDAPGFRNVPRDILLYSENGVPPVPGRRANFDFKKLYANDPVATGGVADLKVTDAMATASSMESSR